MFVVFPNASQCFIPSHHRWFSLPTSSQRIPGRFTRTDRGTPGCSSVCPVSVRCAGVDAEAWHLSGWGAYENISPNLGQMSTSVIIAVVTDSQTLRVLTPQTPRWLLLHPGLCGSTSVQIAFGFMCSVPRWKSIIVSI